MAYIRKLTDKPRKLPYRAQIRRKGHKVQVKMFASKREAEHWADEQERAIRLTGLPQTINDLKKHTVAEIVTRYRDEITPTKGCRVSETTVLNKFLRHKICAKSLAYVTRQDTYSYRDDRLKEKWQHKFIKPSTVRREINTLQHVFEVAREQWGFTGLQNPFRGLKIRGSVHRRKRRLKEGELEALEQYSRDCRGLNRYYVPLAIYLAVETGMRLQEIFNLTWQDVDTDKRRIEIRKSKTDYLTGQSGRTIVLTLGAHSFLTVLRCSLIENRRFKSTDRIFPMTKNAFKQSWSDVIKRAGIHGLTFHDLRREAGSRFEAARLTKGEQDLMMGHVGRDMTSLYIEADLKSIQDGLDKYVLDGMTLVEALEKHGAVLETMSISAKPRVIKSIADVPLSMQFQSEEEMKKYIKKEQQKVRQGVPMSSFPPHIGTS
jgi:integrase